METRTDKPTEQPPAPAPAETPTPAPRPFRPAAFRLAVMVLLFAGWMAYLVYQAATLPRTSDGRPLVLSRSQFLVSEIDVIAKVNARGDLPDNEVEIQEVLYPKGETLPQKVRIVNMLTPPIVPLPPLPGVEDNAPRPTTGDWTGADTYILPLVTVKDAEGKVVKDTYRIAPTPATPGYPRAGDGPMLMRDGAPRIYPATPGALAQYRSIKKP